MNKISDIPPDIDLDDPKFRIRPYQQIIASCTGALLTSLIGKFVYLIFLHSSYLIINYYSLYV